MGVCRAEGEEDKVLKEGKVLKVKHSDADWSNRNWGWKASRIVGAVSEMNNFQMKNNNNPPAIDVPKK